MRPGNLEGPFYARCTHPGAAVPFTSPVDGSVREYDLPAESMRAPSRACGPDGKLWESKDGSDEVA